MRKGPGVRSEALAAVLTLVAAGCSDIACPEGQVRMDQACLCSSGLPFDEEKKECPERSSTQPDGGTATAPTGTTEFPDDRNADPSTPSRRNDAAVPPGPPTPEPDSGASPGGSGGSDAGVVTPPAPPPGPEDDSTNPQNPEQTCVDRDPSPFDECVYGMPASCGDRRVWTGHEDCEVGINGATDDNCVRCHLTRYQVCGTQDDCVEVSRTRGEVRFGDVCMYGICTPQVCPPKSEEWCGAPESCPGVPGYETVLRAFTYCFIECGVNDRCPTGLTCDPSDWTCKGPGSHGTAAANQ